MTGPAAAAGNRPPAAPPAEAPAADGDGHPRAAARPPEEAQPDEPELVSHELVDLPVERTVLPRLVKVAGAVLGSTTVLTGLLFYFGRLHVTGFFRYLRVNFTVLDLTANDYLIRSADGLFVPMTTVAVCGLLALWGHRFVLGRLPPDRRRQLHRTAVPAAAAVGTTLVMVALVELFADRPLVPPLPWVGGVALAGGVLLLAWAVHLARGERPAHRGERRPDDAAALAEGGFAFLLVTIGLFWAVGAYAIDVGTGRAREAVAGLSGAADAVLYSERSLRLAVVGVTEVRCQDPEAAYRFRYDGLKLVLQSGDQYLLLSADWTRENGTAVLVPRTDSVRLEFAPAGQQRSDAC